MSKQINKVSKQDCLQAIEYLFVQGYTQEMTSDKRYFTEILLKKDRSKEIQEILLKNILWDYISENDIPEISRRLEETEKG